MRKYRPSNGTEGMWFEEQFCCQCINQHPDPEKGKNCDIACATFCYDLNDPEYPKEWCYDENDKPTCTAFVKWDWGNWDDDEGFNEPPPVVPDDPNQLCFPFAMNDILKDHQVKETA